MDLIKTLLQSIQHRTDSTGRPLASRGWMAGLAIMLILSLTGVFLWTNRSDVSLSAQNLIENMIASEKRIEDIQLHITCTLPIETHTTVYETDWGRDQGKEFFKTQWTKTDNSSQTIVKQKQSQTAYDGELLWQLEIVPGWTFSKGSISTARTNPFSGKLSFNTLLGSDNWFPLSLGEGLALSESVTIRDHTEQVDGHCCYVLEAVVTNQTQQIIAWVDFQRDYRVLRLETYTNRGRKPFSHLQTRLDHIELKQIEGIWLPVQGTRSHPWNTTAKAQTLAVDVNSIRLNKGIPEEMFSIAFPEGCVVENELTEKNYIAGDISEQEAALTDADWQTRMRQLSTEELIACLSQAKPTPRWRNPNIVGDYGYATAGFGWENVKWFAPMCRLIELGLPAIEPVSAELGRSKDPWMQSRLAFVLRGISKQEAIPALIEALERCAYGMDSYVIEGPGTELDEPLKPFRMDPREDEFCVGRPVREITLALERITCHTEGHEHFFFHSSEGERLPHYGQGKTPETMDRQRALRRTVAQRWREWWQKNGDKPMSQTWSPDMLPMPIEESSNTRGGILIEGMYGNSTGKSSLSLAIVPSIGDPNQVPFLTQQDYQQYVNEPSKDPWKHPFFWANSFQWVRVHDSMDPTEQLPFMSFDDQSHVLLCARQAYVLRPWAENDEMKWSVEDVQIERDATGAPVIRIRFDDNGSRLLRELSQANVGNHLAVCIDHQVVCISEIKAPLERDLVLSGDFTEVQANILATKLSGAGTSDPRIGSYRQLGF